MRHLKDFKSFFYLSEDTRVILAFNGTFTQDLIVSLGETLKNELGQLSSLSLVNRCFGIFVEMAQNVMHYSNSRSNSDSEGSGGKGSIMFCSVPEGFMVMTSNQVDVGEMENIQNRVREINKMDPEDLKNLYLVRRRQKHHENFQGAGLGMMDIARRSGRELGMGFLPDGVGKLMFFFRVIIPV